jgi:hypothetical protein
MDLVEALFDSLKAHPLFVALDATIQNVDWLLLVVAVVTLAFSWVLATN